MRMPSRAIRAARRCAICSMRRWSFDRHGFLLGYEKTLQISGRKKPPQKALAFFCGSARFGIAKSLLLQFQFFRSPPPGGFSFCYVIGFPSNICEHRNGRIPESEGPRKKCVLRIGQQQARLGKRSVPARPPAMRIRRQGLRCLGIDVYAIGVDRCGLLVGGGEEFRRIQAA